MVTTYVTSIITTLKNIYGEHNTTEDSTANEILKKIDFDLERSNIDFELDHHQCFQVLEITKSIQSIASLLIMVKVKY